MSSNARGMAEFGLGRQNTNTTASTQGGKQKRPTGVLRRACHSVVENLETRTLLSVNGFTAELYGSVGGSSFRSLPFPTPNQSGHTGDYSVNMATINTTNGNQSVA